MSKQRSGLLSGLVIGLFAALVGTAAFGAALLYQDRLPQVVRDFGDGLPLLAAVAFVLGVLIGWAVRLVRPRSVLLSLITALYAAATVPGGLIIMGTYILSTAGEQHFDPVVPIPPLTFQDFLDALPESAWQFWASIETASWQLPAVVAAAALPAFVLVLSRALRLRRTGRHAAADKPQRDTASPEPAAPEQEPEYRAPFEPLQPPKQDPASTGSFFLPPDRDPA